MHSIFSVYFKFESIIKSEPYQYIMLYLVFKYLKYIQFLQHAKYFGL